MKKNLYQLETKIITYSTPSQRINEPINAHKLREYFKEFSLKYTLRYT